MKIQATDLGQVESSRCHLRIQCEQYRCLFPRQTIVKHLDLSPCQVGRILAHCRLGSALACLPYLSMLFLTMNLPQQKEACNRNIMPPPKFYIVSVGLRMSVFPNTMPTIYLFQSQAVMTEEINPKPLYESYGYTTARKSATVPEHILVSKKCACI